MIYILEFEKPIGSDNPRGQARYYIGYCEDSRYVDRMFEHSTGYGAAITRWAVNHGIGFKTVVTVEGGTRRMERAMKNYKNTPALVRSYQNNPFGFIKRWAERQKTYA
jgi:predicted GIY-YIG superfamily endonuclease